MIDLSTVLKHYKRKDVQEAMVAAASGREIAVKFGEKGFGKRPDTLKYPSDILEFAKQGATSFHCSEERWKNPLQISTSLKKSELEELRTGWDLVLDIDCPNWTISKVIAHLLIRALKDHGITSITSKFSGNKGFHIAVPFEAMPKKVRGKDVHSLFPEGPRKIAAYLIDYISKNYTRVMENSIVEFGDVNIRIPLKKIAEVTGKSFEDVTKRFCTQCGAQVKIPEQQKAVQFLCARCGAAEEGLPEERIKKCAKCGSIMERFDRKLSLCRCGSDSYETRFIPSSIVEVDTVLISSRHLYRMPFSLHEKSGLVSIPIEPEKIMQFEKKMAMPENVDAEKIRFLDCSKTQEGEAEGLLLKSEHYADSFPGNEAGNGNEPGRQIEEMHFEQAVPKELFPPCIQKILQGIEDGKKRSVFVLLNFLTNLGWDYEKIEALLKEWNEKNPEPLRDVSLVGQLRYHKQNKKKVLPPNCDNTSYYKGFGVCSPDGLCAKVKNPVSYSIRKARFLNRQKEKSEDSE